MNVTECHPRGPLPPPVESAASGSHHSPGSPPFVSCQSCSLVLLLSSSPSCSFALLVSLFVPPSPPRSPTPDAATSRSGVGWLVRRLRGCPAGVAWTEINIRRASTYSIPLPCSIRSRPLCPLLSSHSLVLSLQPPDCHPILPYLFNPNIPHPLYRTVFPRGWTSTHTCTHIHTRAHARKHRIVCVRRAPARWQTKHFCTGCVSLCNG